MSLWRAARMAGSLLLGLVISSPLLAADTVALSGLVRDSIGEVLAGVEVLVLGPSETVTPVAVVLSDERGRFAVPELVPGFYRIAALKDGYGTFVGQVDTWVQRTIDVVLHPSVDLRRLPESRLPRNGSWALRSPRRGILRDVDNGIPADSNDPIEARDDRFADAMRVQLEQLFSVSAQPAGGSDQASDLEATETRMLLASAIGERGKIWVRGRRERLGSTAPDDASVAVASQQASTMRMRLSYETSPDATLAVEAFYDRQGYQLSSDPTDLAGRFEQEQRSWGYDATWSKQIDESSRVAVDFDYHDTSLAHPQDPGSVPLGLDVAEPGAFANRKVSARGSFDRTKADTHELQVAFRAQMLEWPTTPFAIGGVEAPAGPIAPSRWSLQAEAQDTWSISAPFSLVLGLGYEHALVPRETALVVPRLGGVWSRDGWLFRGLLTYHSASDRGGPAPAGRPVFFQPEQNVGYDTELAIPLGMGVSLRGGSRYAPVQLELFGQAGGLDSPASRPLYLTDGNAAVREHRLALANERGDARTYLELSHGTADGTLTALLPFDLSYPSVSDRSLSYRSGRFGMHMPSRGTDVLLEYQRIVSQAAVEQDRESASIQETIEMRLKKDMWGLQAAGDWRLLLALRLGSVETAGPEERQQRDDALNALNRRISAGVSVMF